MRKLTLSTLMVLFCLWCKGQSADSKLSLYCNGIKYPVATAQRLDTSLNRISFSVIEKSPKVQIKFIPPFVTDTIPVYVTYNPDAPRFLISIDSVQNMNDTLMPISVRTLEEFFKNKIYIESNGTITKFSEVRLFFFDLYANESPYRHTIGTPIDLAGVKEKLKENVYAGISGGTFLLNGEKCTLTGIDIAARIIDDNSKEAKFTE